MRCPQLFLAWAEFFILWGYLTMFLTHLVEAYTHVIDRETVMGTQKVLNFLRRASPVVVGIFIFLLLIDLFISYEHIQNATMADCNDEESVSHTSFGDIASTVTDSAARDRNSSIFAGTKGSALKDDENTDPLPLYFFWCVSNSWMITKVRARTERLSALSILHSKSVLYGTFVWARRAPDSP
jgi:hypothetical protein